MTDLKYTPGPWTVEEARGVNNKLCFHSIHSSDGEYLCATWSDPHEANANLIAAAPELLEALEDAAARLRLERHVRDGEPTVGGELEQRIDAVIAKAKGEQP